VTPMTEHLNLSLFLMEASLHQNKMLAICAMLLKLTRNHNRARNRNLREYWSLLTSPATGGQHFPVVWSLLTSATTKRRHGPVEGEVTRPHFLVLADLSCFRVYFT